MESNMAMRNIIVVPYDPRWVAHYEAEAETLRNIFGDDLITIHHIGSTSIPYLAAKPVIDIMPLVDDIERVKLYIPQMESVGYHYRGENAIPGRQYFVKGPNAHRTHHVHIYNPSNLEVKQHLDFRDYLRAHPATAQEYGKLKSRLASRFRDDILGYMEGKHQFIQDTIAKARLWRMEQTG